MISLAASFIELSTASPCFFNLTVHSAKCSTVPDRIDSKRGNTSCRMRLRIYFSSALDLSSRYVTSSRATQSLISSLFQSKNGLIIFPFLIAIPPNAVGSTDLRS